MKEEKITGEKSQMVGKILLLQKRIRKYLLLLSLVAVLSISVFSTLSIAFAQEIPDELIFKYCKPEEIYAHQNPLIPGYGKLMLSVYESLAYYDDLTVGSVGYKPLLAESWRWIDDTTFEIKVRKIAHFRDPWGPVTADDVVFSLQTQLRKDIGGNIADIADYIASVEKVDDLTVHVKYKAEYANYKGTLAYILEAFIVSKNRWSKLLEQYGTNIVQYTNTENPDEWDNSGPYALLKYGRDAIIYRRVDNYWGEQLGWLFAPEYYGAYGDSSSDALYRLMDAHERDMNSQAAEISVEWKRARSNYLGAWNIDAKDPFMIHGFEWVGHGFTLNYVRRPIFREQWFRMALAYATDYDKICESGYYGQAIPGYWLPIHPNYLEYAKKFNYVLENNFPNVTYRPDGTARIPYDPKTAIRILTEHCDSGSSVENGWYYKGEKIGPFSLTVVAPWRATVVAAEVTAKTWSDIGIPTTPNPVEINTFFDVRERKMDYDAIYNWYWVDTNPYGILEPDLNTNMLERILCAST